VIASSSPQPRRPALRCDDEYSCRARFRYSPAGHVGNGVRRFSGEEAMKIGFVGTGTMGRPMLGNLVKKGFAVSAYDVVPAALDAAVELGAARAGSPAAAADCDLVITMLPSSANVEAAYLGAGGII